jgi:hypothetical protein
MRKITVRFDNADLDRLHRLAEREGRSASAIVRDAIALYDEQKPVRKFLLTGSWHGTGRSIADIPEEELMRGFGEDLSPEDA